MTTTTTNLTADCFDLCPDDADKTVEGTCDCGLSDDDSWPYGGYEPMLSDRERF